MKLEQISYIVTILSPLILGYLAYYIPKKILTNQIFSDLIKEYRSAEIGVSIFEIINFYKNECNSKLENMKDKYIRIFNKEIGNYKKQKTIEHYQNTLHFHRRVLSQYYLQLGASRFSGFYFTRPSKNLLKSNFTHNDSDLIFILYKLNTEVVHHIHPHFETELEIKESKKEDSSNKLNKYLNKLYKESKKWKKY
jgi:hypothetical protein